jgi:hypothetical protein
MRKLIAYSLLVMILLIVSGCGPAPGEGRKAEEGYELSQTIIDALEQYKADQGEYPATLDELIPDYLAAIPTGQYVDEWVYTPTDDGKYTLMFSYVGPCMNTCTYSPDGGWDCGGYC